MSSKPSKMEVRVTFWKEMWKGGVSKQQSGHLKISEFVFRSDNPSLTQARVQFQFTMVFADQVYFTEIQTWYYCRFKAANPDCPFSLSGVIREFLQNEVTQTSCDLQRNTCPVHANAHGLINCLHKNGIAKHITTSCRWETASQSYICARQIMRH